jgi:hypothetical protein
LFLHPPRAVHRERSHGADEPGVAARIGRVAHTLLKMFRRFLYGEPIVVVSGLPRSGTSMVMKMLEAGGLSMVTDGVRSADEDNPKGYYEDERVKNLHVDEDRAWLRQCRGRAVKVISYLIKTLPPDNNYKVLFMERNLKEILASQSKMLTRRGETSETPDERMMELLQQDLAAARFFLRRAHFDLLDVQYKEVLDHPREQARRIAVFLGRPLDIAAMVRVVDATLYRNRA